MTMALLDHIKRRIALEGPLSIADYMTICLLHPTEGYYTTRDPFGAAGDFTTAPEISQMFGELIGLALAQAWLDQGKPKGALVELGPGRGTLMADILRATRAVPGFHQACPVHLVEASAHLRELQCQAVPSVTHHSDINTLPDTALFLVANEFFDALPVRQFIRAGSAWAERVVTVIDDTLTFAATPPSPLAALEHRLDTTSDGDIVETNAPAQAISGDIARRIAAFGGAALYIDYGHWADVGDTFQAVAHHAPTDPLTQPGMADLTAHVDFKALAQVSQAATYSTLTPQGVFLEHLGITARARDLATSLDGQALETHIAAHKRLTHPKEMGTLFKAMGIVPNGALMIPGLLTDTVKDLL